MILLSRCALIWVTLLFSVTSQASVTVGGTRLVYNSTSKEASISVSNTPNAVPHLIQSWVENEYSDTDKVPFIVTPPLFRLDGGRENTLRVIYSGTATLPDNRESLFWLNVKAIPAVEKSEQNRLLIAVRTRIKLFYRPGALNSEAANTAWKQLVFKRRNEQVNITNPTPYYISLFSLKLGKEEIKNPPTVPPFGSINVTGKGESIFWKAINDFGVITTEESKSL